MKKGNSDTHRKPSKKVMQRAMRRQGKLTKKQKATKLRMEAAFRTIANQRGPEFETQCHNSFFEKTGALYDFQGFISDGQLRKDIPWWILGVEKGWGLYDRRGIDLLVRTDVGIIAIQLKSSGKKAERFEKEHNDDLIGVVVGKIGEKEDELRNRIIKKCERMRKKLQCSNAYYLHPAVHEEKVTKNLVEDAIKDTDFPHWMNHIKIDKTVNNPFVYVETDKGQIPIRLTNNWYEKQDLVDTNSIHRSQIIIVNSKERDDIDNYKQTIKDRILYAANKAYRYMGQREELLYQ